MVKLLTGYGRGTVTYAWYAWRFPSEELGLRIVAGGKKPVTVDIVAVHGLAADPRKTWTLRKLDSTGATEEEGTNWLRDLLPKDIPRAQISTFNYASQWLVDAPKESIQNLASKLLSGLVELRKKSKRDDESAARPLVLIGHSFGGLVIQKALVLASQNEEHRDLLLHTSAVFFLGTPHRGSKVASLGKVLGNCAAALGAGSTTGLLEILEEQALGIPEFVEEFAIQAREVNIDIICFYELYATRIVRNRFVPGFSEMVVSRDSATLPGWRGFGLTADHSGLNKFGSREDANYELVISRLKERVKQGPASIKKRLEAYSANKPLKPIHFVVPHMRNSLFKPRASVSRRLQTMFKKVASFDDLYHLRIALYGLAGGGKTQRLLDLAYTSRGKRNVFWINGATKESFRQTLTTIGTAVHPVEHGLIKSQTDLMLATKDWLESPRSGEWLLLIDGANDPTAEFWGYVEPFLPHKRGAVVFSSTTAQIVNTVGSPEWAIEIGPMDHADASSLFRKVAGIKKKSVTGLDELLEHLEHVPLAITQAASYVRTRGVSVEKYVDLYTQAEDHSRGILFDPSSMDPHDYTSEVSRSVMTTWTLTLEQVERVNPDALLLLRYMSLLGPNISISVLQHFCKKHESLRDDIAFHDAVGLLNSYRLVTRSHSSHLPEDTFRLHRLISLRTRMNMGDDKSRWAATVLDTINDLFPYTDVQRRKYDWCSALIQHAEAALLHSSKFEELEDVRNQLRSKMELYNFYSYEYKRERVDVLSLRTSRQAAETSLGVLPDTDSVRSGGRDTWTHAGKVPDGLEYDMDSDGSFDGHEES